MANVVNDVTTASRRSQVFLVLGCVIGLLILCFFVWASAKVEGDEFSPSHFQTRRFELRAVFNLQLQKIVHTDKTDSTSQYLIAQKLINVPSGKPKRWDLVNISSSSNTADTDILISHLASNRWETWSKNHPKAAPVLWSFVQRMAIDDLYLLLPRVFEIAEAETNPVRLQSALDLYLTGELPSFATDVFYSGREQDAINMLKSALKTYHDNLGLKAVLSKLLGES